MRIWPRSRVKQLESDVVRLQHTVTSSLDILQQLQSVDQDGGNKYASYAAKVMQLSRMYEGEASWGNQICQSIINVRAYFIMGSGVHVNTKEIGDRESAFLESFLKLNGIDHRSPLEWCREAQIEGRALLRLTPNKDIVNGDGTVGNVRVQLIPWTVYKYEVKQSRDDPNVFESVTWNNPKPVTLTAGEFVYLPFGGRSHRVNNTPPLLANCIREMEAIDKALFDWRKINHLFAAPTPYIKAPDIASARSTYAKIKDSVWKIGKLLVTNGDYSMVGPEMAGVEWLRNEIVVSAQLIAAVTGIPPHFLGFPELIGAGRATGDNLMESIQSATNGERNIWVDGFDELINKAVAMATNKLQRGVLDVTKLSIDIPFVSQQHMQELADVWLPLWMANAISHETLLAHVPEIDVEDEMKLIEDKKEENALHPVKFPPVIPGQEEEEEEK